MKQYIFGTLLILGSLFLGFIVAASSIYAAADSPNFQKSRPKESRIGNLVASSVTKGETAANGGRLSTLREKRSDRRGRFITGALEDLNYSASLSAEDITRLSRLVDAMTPLESPKREYDIRSLLDWYYRYSDWIGNATSECEEMLQSPPTDADLKSFSSGLTSNYRDSKKEVDDMLRSHQAELKNLFRILERRQSLNERLHSLHERLSGIEGKLKDRQTQGPQRSQGEERARRVKEDISVVQTELLSLVDINEELLKHYVVMIEMARDQVFWLGLKEGEYQLLANLSRTVGSTGPKDTPRLVKAYQGLIRGYENEIKKLDRKIDELDRKRSGVSQVGSFRDLDRSEELSDFYLDRRQRYTDFVNRLKIRIGGAESELSQLLPGR